MSLERPKPEEWPSWVVAVNGSMAICNHPKCKARIWWATTREGKKQPFDVSGRDEKGKLVPHHMTCPGAEQYRKARDKYHTCVWLYQPDDGSFMTECGVSFMFREDKLEKFYRFCPNCGKKIKGLES